LKFTESLVYLHTRKFEFWDTVELGYKWHWLVSNLIHYFISPSDALLYYTSIRMTWNGKSTVIAENVYIYACLTYYQ